MAKIDQEVRELKSSVSKLDEKIGQLQFYLIQIMNKLDEEGVPTGEESTAAVSSGNVSVDISPLEDRLEELSKEMITKKDIEPLKEELTKLRSERMKEADETIDKVTVLLEKGLALTELTSSLRAIEAHLQELVEPPK
ncbi:MAG: hypothetical protein U9O98_08985 [Asgard group archaeon]|nr:hypothetical protein [Asgard group archaeon]